MHARWAAAVAWAMGWLWPHSITKRRQVSNGALVGQTPSVVIFWQKRSLAWVSAGALQFLTQSCALRAFGLQFCETHMCNPICKYLGLKSLNGCGRCARYLVCSRLMPSVRQSLVMGHRS